MSVEGIIAITMPKWGMSMETGKVVDWLKEEGDSIEKGMELMDVETEKIVNSLESNHDGILARKVAAVDEELPVGALLGVLINGDVNDTDVDAFVEKYQQEFVPEVAAEAVDNTPAKIDVDDLTIAYRHIPARNEGHTIPLLLIHGFGGDQNSWLFNITDLSEQQTVYTLDLPGHGESVKQVASGGLEELAGLVARWMAAVGLERAHIAGHSMGAAVAVQLALDHGEQVASLSLLGGAGPGTTVNEDYITGFLAADRRKAIKPYLQQLFADESLVNRDMIENVLKAKRIEGANACLQQIASTAVLGTGSRNPAETLSSLQVPVQLLWGNEDRIATPENTAGLESIVTVHIIDAAGHMLHMEQAGRVNELLKSFIGSLDGQHKPNGTGP